MEVFCANIQPKLKKIWRSTKNQSFLMASGGFWKFTQYWLITNPHPQFSDLLAVLNSLSWILSTIGHILAKRQKRKKKKRQNYQKWVPLDMSFQNYTIPQKLVAEKTRKEKSQIHSTQTNCFHLKIAFNVNLVVEVLLRINMIIYHTALVFQFHKLRERP